MVKEKIVNSPTYGTIVYKYIDTINTYEYELGRRYSNIGSVYIAPVDDNKNSPMVHLYYPTKECNEDLVIADKTKKEVLDLLKKLKRERT